MPRNDMLGGFGNNAGMDTNAGGGGGFSAPPQLGMKPPRVRGFGNAGGGMAPPQNGFSGMLPKMSQGMQPGLGMRAPQAPAPPVRMPQGPPNMPPAGPPNDRMQPPPQSNQQYLQYANPMLLRYLMTLYGGRGRGGF